MAVSIFTWGQADPKMPHTLHQVIQSLSKDYQVQFAFESTMEASQINPDYNPEDPLAMSLKQVFFFSNIEFKINGTQVLLRTRNDQDARNHLKGRAIDANSGQGLPWVLITGQGIKPGYTDSLGYFMIENGAESLRFHFLGYSDRIITPVPREGIMVVALHPGINRIPVVKISSSHPAMDRLAMDLPAQLGTRQFASLPTGNDILRSLQLRPGIAAHQDASALIRIRGSEAFETMIELDGMVIYNPTHFYNFFSAINGPYVSQTELYRNNLPIQFAGRTGGLIKMKSEDLTDPLLGLQGDFDLLNAALRLELPVGPSSGLLLSGRTSYTDVGNSVFFDILQSNNEDDFGDNKLRKYLVENLQPSFNYADFNTKFQVNPRVGHRFDMNLYYSRDRLSNTFFDHRFNQTYVSEFLMDYNDQSGWSNLGLSANYDIMRDTGAVHHFTLNYSRSDFNQDFSIENYLLNRNTERSLYYSNRMENQIGDLHARWYSQRQMGEPYLYIYGMEMAAYSTHSNISADESMIYDREIKEANWGLFQELRIGTGRDELSLGGRLQYLFGLRQFIFDPRISLGRSWQDSKFRLYGNFSINHQFLSQFSYENHLGQAFDFWTLSTSDIPIIRSWNSIIGFSHRGGKQKWMMEVYWKKRENITELAILKPGITDADQPKVPEDQFVLFVGEGRIIGMDLWLEQHFGDYTTDLQYTLSTNLVKFEQIFNGNPFPDRDHRLHQFKWLNNYQLKGFRINLNAIYSSGKPYLNISTLTKIKNRKDLDVEENLSYLPYYFRLDAGISYSKKFRGRELQAGISIFNLTDRRNVYQAQYIRPVQAVGSGSLDWLAVGTESSMLHRTLNLSLSLRI